MKVYIKISITIILMLLTNSVHSQSEGTEIIINISGISSDEGQIIVHLYDSEEEFLEYPIKTELSKIVDGKANVVIKEVPEGIYAIGVIHDENNNNEIDFNFIGMPTEDVAASNNAKGFFGPPSFDDAKFEVSAESVALKIKM